MADMFFLYISKIVVRRTKLFFFTFFKMPTWSRIPYKKSRKPKYSPARLRRKYRSRLFGPGRYPRLARLVRGYVERKRFRQSTRNQLAEVKLIPTNVYNELGPGPIAVGAWAYYVGFVLQSLPTGWDGSLNNLSGIDVAQGLTGSTRIGNYVYYKKTHLSLQVDMNALVYSAPPIEFRFVVLKSRQSVMPAGSTDQPQLTMYLNTVGAQQGYQTPGFNGMDLMQQPLNRRDWVIFRDQKFTLSSPMMTDSDGGNVGYSGKYPCRKNLHVNLNHWKKTRLSAANLPTDYDAHYLIYIFASAIGKDHTAANWEVSTRGTTSFTDS